MRIIGGSARGRTLLAPPGNQTRPTQDYVRESLFNILMRDVPGATVLDLFAGSGALALESISRGADSAVLVDQAAGAAATVRRNIAQLGFDAQCTLLTCDWRQALHRLSQSEQVFDLIFLDPPYALTDTGAIAEALLAHRLLAPGALLVVEHRRDAPPDPVSGFAQTDQRTYGDTWITFLRREENGHA